VAKRRTNRTVASAAPTIAAHPNATTFVETQVRQTLQQTATVGAWSP
jgi:hypothetical protein